MSQTKCVQKLKIGLIGFGLHTRRVYWQCLKKIAAENDSNFCIQVLVDLNNKKHEIETFIHNETNNESLIPKHSFYLNTCTSSQQSVLSDLKSQNLDAIIISTDPRSRDEYLRFAINENIKVLCDKPLLIPSTHNKNMNIYSSASNVFESQYFDICNLLKQKQSMHSSMDITLNCQRRRHSAYQFIIQYLSDFIFEFQLPLNFIHINHSDGLCLTPSEYVKMENHPFKYGYGKLVNSGYHFIDLLLWLQSTSNHALNDERKRANVIELCANERYSIYDDFHSLNFDDWEKLYSKHTDCDRLKRDKKEFMTDPNDFYGFGELDSFNLFQFKHKNENNEKYSNVITTASVQLLHKSFSRRSWIQLPKDVNKENGRIRHELLTITIGPLLTMHIRSFQSFEDQKIFQNKEQMIEMNAVGGANHFEIDIFRNSQLCGGQTYQHVDFGKESESLMFESRYRVLCDFLNGNDVSDMSILSKNAMDTVRLISAIYKKMASQNNNSRADDNGGKTILTL